MILKELLDKIPNLYDIKICLWNYDEIIINKEYFNLNTLERLGLKSDDIIVKWVFPSVKENKSEVIVLECELLNWGENKC